MVIFNKLIIITSLKSFESISKMANKFEAVYTYLRKLYIAFINSFYIKFEVFSNISSIHYILLNIVFVWN